MFCSQKISQFLKESYFKVVVLLFLYHPELLRYHKPVQKTYLITFFENRWPLHEEHCQQARCAACAPAVTTASAVCQRSFGPEGQTHKCVQTVMGEGFCNYCIDDYL